MPGGDRTGPMGMGSMSGRGLGYCAGYTAPGFANAMPGRGFGFGGGFGRGRGLGLGLGFRGGRGRATPYFGASPFYGAPSAATFGETASKRQQAQALQEQAEYLEQALEDIRKRISALEAEKAEA